MGEQDGAGMNVQVIEDVVAEGARRGVDTLEGLISPLLYGQGCQAHMISMPAGLFVGEHPHSTESIIYTVSGKWVLASGGEQFVMGAGSLFHFAPGAPTGYEVPFDEEAVILIFKGERSMGGDAEFIGYLEQLAVRLEGRQAAGEVFRLSGLPEDHPAVVFARGAGGLKGEEK